MFTITMTRQNQCGFTLVEIVVAITLASFIALMAILITTTGIKNIRVIEDTKVLTTDAHFVVDTFTYWVKQAKNVNVPSSSILEISLPDESGKTISETGGAITVDASPITSDDVEIADLSFTKLARSVQISFVVKSKSSGRTFPVQTTVAFRNK